MTHDEGFHQRGVGSEHFNSLRKFLEIAKARRHRYVLVERLAQGRRKLRRQGRLQTYQRHAGLAVLGADFYAVRGMRIDHRIRLTIYATNGRYPIGMRARAGDKTE